MTDEAGARRHDPHAWWDQVQARAVEDHAMALCAARLAEPAGRQAGSPAR